ncbi:hypothetical protein RJT34_21945 [Clitoria ternatea]|uniref:Uncharacterized protein n=1 Tax=Clitoria ternatea TaxID=43366 RepID=A0AAN9IW82_CLITE
MGREIIRQSSPEEPENRSRLWAHEDVFGVLKEHTGTKAIEGLVLKMEDTSKDCFDTKAFENMKKLRLLKLNGVQLRHVVAIDLKYSSINKVWKETRLLEKLKILNLSHSTKLKHTPNLEKLILKHCTGLTEVHQSIGDLSKLLVINLMGCTSLSNLPSRIYQLKSVKTLNLSGCVKIDKLEEEIVQMESLTTLIAKDTAIEKMPRSIVELKSIGYISLCGYEGLAHDIFPSIIRSWISPTMNPLLLVSMDMQKNNMGDLVAVQSSCAEFRSVWVQCRSKFQLNEELRRILDNQCDVNFTDLEITSYASQVSDLSLRLRSLLIGMGSYHIVIDTLGKSISQGLTIGESADFSLPGDNYPYWLNHTGEGRSVIFKVPQATYCSMKGMALCVVYSSTLENATSHCLISVLIVNYTKCIFQIYKKDTTVSFNDEDWQGIVSNLEPGDDVEMIVVFGHEFTVKKTSVYLICDEELV